MSLLRPKDKRRVSSAAPSRADARDRASTARDSASMARDDDETAFSRWSRMKRMKRESAAADDIVDRVSAPGKQDIDSAAVVDRDSETASESQPLITQRHINVDTDTDTDTGVDSAGRGGDANTDASVGGDAREGRILTDEDMPSIASLTPDSDFKPFMSKGVSHALRRKALRKLFHSPYFQVRDGLDDYDDDFRSFAPLGDTVTADMKFAKEREEMLRREAEEEQIAARKALAEEQEDALTDTDACAEDSHGESDKVRAEVSAENAKEDDPRRLDDEKDPRETAASTTPDSVRSDDVADDTEIDGTNSESPSESSGHSDQLATKQAAVDPIAVKPADLDQGDHDRREKHASVEDV